MIPQQLKLVIEDIEKTTKHLPQFTPIQGWASLTADEALMNELAGQHGAYLIRFILNRAGNDEQRIFRWRLENKYIQYHVLSNYCPCSLPHSIGLSEVMDKKNGSLCIKNLLSNGYFLKAALGDASLATNSWDKSNLLEEVLDKFKRGEEYESYLLQFKLRLYREFRIHSFDKQIIPNLSFRVPSTQDSNYHQAAEAFLLKNLNKLPNAITSGTLIGWDIGLTDKNEYYIIEANFTGFHPEYRRGFQTTGYVDLPVFGPIITAWLNNYFRKYYNVCVEDIHPDLYYTYQFYQDFTSYDQLFKNSTVFHNKTGGTQALSTLIVYLGDASSIFFANLMEYFAQVDFSRSYYLIGYHICFESINSYLLSKHNFVIVDEESLFTQQQHQLIRQLGYERKKQICAHQVARKFKMINYIIL